MASASDRERERRNLYAEVYRLAERNETLTRYVEVLQRKLDALTVEAGMTPPTISVADAIAPVARRAARKITVPAKHSRRSSSPLATMTARQEAPIDTAWWPTQSTAAAPLVPAAGWRNYTLQKRNAKVVGVSVCGMPRPTLESVVAAVSDQQDRLRDFIPVFLTDSTDFDVFRRYGFVWEYFLGPVARARYAGTTSWTHYAAARRQLLARKWNFDHVICIGATEFGVIDVQRAPRSRRIKRKSP
jgi:hypothetical protein